MAEGRTQPCTGRARGPVGALTPGVGLGGGSTGYAFTLLCVATAEGEGPQCRAGAHVRGASLSFPPQCRLQMHKHGQLQPDPARDAFSKAPVRPNPGGAGWGALPAEHLATPEAALPFSQVPLIRSGRRGLPWTYLQEYLQLAVYSQTLRSFPAQGHAQ